MYISNIRILAMPRRLWRLVLVLFTCVLPAPPSSADLFPFRAVTLGTVESGPFTQLLSGVLINFFDPTEKGLANSILQERTIAGYTWQPAGPPTFITLAQVFSIQVIVNNALNPPQPNVNMNVSAAIAAQFLAPPILFGPFTVEQRGNNVPPIPIKGPNNGLVAETHATSVILDQGPITIADPPVLAPPLPIVLSGGVDTGETPGFGRATKMADRIIAIHFLDEFSLNGGPFVPYAFADLDVAIDDTASLTFTPNFDFFDVVTNPTPVGFDVIGAGFLSSTFPVAPGDNYRFRHTLDAQLRIEFVPEPSSLVLIGIGLAALRLGKRRLLKGYHKGQTRMALT